MYSVSADYLTALSAPVKRFRLSGSVGSVSFTQANVVSGSLQITNKCSEGSEIKIGSVYTGQLKCTFTGLNIARGSWNGKVITLSEGLQLADETYEDVPLGVFIVSKANHTTQGVEVTAYDAMTAFDKDVSFDTTTGEPYDLLDYICTQCGVTLANTRASIEALPNGTEELDLYATNDISTFRDMLFWLVQALGAFATINRSGYLDIREYSVISAQTIDESHRFAGCSFSDFVTQYTGMSVTDVENEQVKYYAVSPDDGLTYNLGANPFLQHYLDGTQDIIGSFSAVELTPFKASMLGGAIYDLGDCLTFSGGIAQGAVCGVMAYSYKYNGGYEIEGFGENPALANARSKTDHDISGLMSTVSGESVVHFTYTNAENVSVTDGGAEQEIIHYHIYASGATWFALNAEIKYTGATTETVGSTYVENDLTVTAKYYLNDELVGYTSVETEQDGVHLLHLDKTFSVPSGGVTLSVTLSCSGGSASVSAGDGNALLWGQKIEANKIVNIVVATLPPNNFNYGLLNYDGLVINGVYTDGTTENITSACNLTPSAGTSISGDATEISATAEYTSPNLEEFSVDFDVPVHTLFTFMRQTSGNAFSGQDAGSVIDIADTVYAIKETKVKASTSTYTLDYAEIELDADGRPTVTANKGQWTTSFSGNKEINSFFKGDKVYVISTDATDIRWFDFSTLTNGTITATLYDDPNATGRTITAVTNRVNNGYPIVCEIDGYVLLPDVTITHSNGSSLGLAYLVFGSGTIDVYALEWNTVGGVAPLFYDTQLVGYPYYADIRTVEGFRFSTRRTSGSGWNYYFGLYVDEVHFDTTNYLTMTQVAFYDYEASWDSFYTLCKIDGSDTFLMRPSGNTYAFVYDSTDWTETNFDATLIDGYMNDKIRFIDDQGVYIHMMSKTSETGYELIPRMAYSYNLETWTSVPYELEENTPVRLDGNYASNLVEDGDYIIGTCYDTVSAQRGFSVKFNATLPSEE